MYLDDPAGNTVLQSLRQNGYKGMVIALSGPSQEGSYELGDLETAVETACGT